MKTKLLFAPLLLLFLNGYAQITKTEAYLVGTKVSFYPDQCGNDIPEAEGKLTFCDASGNLGVVEASYGLNATDIEWGMANNYFNNDEVFLTSNGISIHREDGTWQNIPNFALPRTDVDSSPVMVTIGVVDHNGNLHYRHNNRENSNYINIVTLETGEDEIQGGLNFDEKMYAFDDDTNTLYLLATVTADPVLYAKDEDGLINEIPLPESIDDLFFNNANKMLVRDGQIYILNGLGIYQMDLGTKEVTIYNEANGKIPARDVNDMDFDSKGNIWAASGRTTQPGAVTVIDVVSKTTESYTLQRPNSSSDYSFTDIAVDGNDDVWVLPQSSLGIFKLTVNNGTPNFTEFGNDFFSSQNINFTAFPDILNYENEGLYALGSSTATSFDVSAVFKNNRWTPITDNVPGNLSTAMMRSVSSAYPADDGIWWGNHQDDRLTFIGENDSFKIVNNIGQSAIDIVVDADEQPVVALGSLRKYIEPIKIEFPKDQTDGFNDIERFKDQIWAFDQTSRSIAIYKDNKLIVSYPLTAEYASSFNFKPDALGNAWFQNYEFSTGEFVFRKFDPNTFTTETYRFATATVPTNGKIIAFPNGNMGFVFENGLILFDGINFSRLDNNDESSLQSLVDGIPLKNGDLVVLKRNLAGIIKIKNPFASPEFETILLEDSFESSGIIPYVDTGGLTTIALDSLGNYWVSGSNSSFVKVILADPIEPFYSKGVTYGLRGSVYLDLNNNEVFDAGEGYQNQRLAIVSAEGQRVVYTDVNGEFYLSFNGEGAQAITLLGSNPYIEFTEFYRTRTVNGVDTDTDFGVFRLKVLVYNALLIKSFPKLGAYAFERRGFENNFVTGIGSLLPTRSYTNIKIDFLLKNDNNTQQPLPNIDGVFIYKIVPNDLKPIIDKLLVNPESHAWSVKGSTSLYTKQELNVEPVIVKIDDEIKITYEIPSLEPYAMLVMETRLNRFDVDPQGGTITYGISNIYADDLINSNGVTSAGSYSLIPREDSESISLLGALATSVIPGTPEIQPGFTRPEDVDIFVDEPMKLPILAAYDPNDKLVSPGLPYGLSKVDLDTKYLNYTIRFENMGNFSAKDIFILDEMDENLDLNTLQLVEASHDVQLSQIEIDGKTTLKFAFNDIYLDYTANDSLASQGYVKYVIQPKEGIALNTIVENTASIYFDQNPPIITNTTQTKFVELQLSAAEFDSKGLKVISYPNPVTNYMALKFPVSSKYNIQVLDMLGKQLQTIDTQQTMEHQINLDGLPVGLYLIRVISEKGSATIKILKE